MTNKSSYLLLADIFVKTKYHSESSQRGHKSTIVYILAKAWKHNRTFCQCSYMYWLTKRLHYLGKLHNSSWSQGCWHSRVSSCDDFCYNVLLCLVSGIHNFWDLPSVVACDLVQNAKFATRYPSFEWEHLHTTASCEVYWFNESALWANLCKSIE